MSKTIITLNRVYMRAESSERIRILHIDPELDRAIYVRLNRQSARPRCASLSRLQSDLDIRKLLPVAETPDEVPGILLSEKAAKRGDALQAELKQLLDRGYLQLANESLWKDFTEIGRRLGLTAAAINTSFSKVLQAGGRLIPMISSQEFAATLRGQRPRSPTGR